MKLLKDINPEIIAQMFDAAYNDVYGDDDLQPMSSCKWTNEGWVFTQHDINGFEYKLDICENLSINLWMDNTPVHFNQSECYKILFKELGFINKIENGERLSDNQLKIMDDPKDISHIKDLDDENED